ncbi:HAD superfamily hydrolase, 5'-nucleotidase, partial [Dictyocaulus viviparus]
LSYHKINSKHRDDLFTPHVNFDKVRFIFNLNTNMDTQIFINRSLRLDKIKSIGFDMDATLAIYNSPQSEELAFNLSIDRLIDIGYPEELRELKYQTDFVARNAWFDKKFGHLLKTDEHCNILNAFHGFRKLEKKEIRRYYPNKHVSLDESRIFVLNTVFNVPEALLLATVVDYFDTRKQQYTPLAECIGYKKNYMNQIILYSTIFDDCRNTIEWIHTMDDLMKDPQGDFKKSITSNIRTYIAQDDRAIHMMQKLSGDGKKLFLLTNSPWMFTNTLMSYVMGPGWRKLFDVVIVDGNKPKWFLQDIPFKKVDPETGRIYIGVHSGDLIKEEVYSGGCATEFKNRMNLHGKDILYVGDHIFGDVLKSKKTGGWRTLLIVPELNREMKACAGDSYWIQRIQIWFSQSQKFNELLCVSSNLTSSNSEPSGSIRKETLKEISRITDDMEAEFGAMGSMLRCGWRQTHFAAQLKKYADLYTCNVYNLNGYSVTHYFSSPMTLLPHEENLIQATVNTENGEAEKQQCNGLKEESKQNQKTST